MKQNYTIQRGALDGVEAFIRVADRRSFRAAAVDLGVTPSAVSQAIRALEARIGAALFTRTTRSVGLTEAGERFMERARPAYQEIIAASDAARDLGTKPAGLLRLAVPRGAVPHVLRPLLTSFCAAYPDVVVEIAASEELVDLAKGRFDAGIRFGELIAADMIAVRLTPSLRVVVVGTPTYFARYGKPRTPADLAAHACLRLRRSNGALGSWRLQDRVGPIDLAVSGPLIVNDFPTMVDFALDGLALAQVPEPMARKYLMAGQLEEVLVKHAPSTSGVFLYFPDRKQVLPKLRVFIEHVRAYMAAGPNKPDAFGRKTPRTRSLAK